MVRQTFPKVCKLFHYELGPSKCLFHYGPANFSQSLYNLFRTRTLKNTLSLHLGVRSWALLSCLHFIITLAAWSLSLNYKNLNRAFLMTLWGRSPVSVICEIKSKGVLSGTPIMLMVTLLYCCAMTYSE